MSRNRQTSKPRVGELTAAGRDILFKYGLSGENPDKLLATKGMTYIEEIERDTHLASVLATRRQKLIEKGWKIEPHVSPNGKVTARNQHIADSVKWAIDNMTGAFEKDVEGFLDALGKGFSISEIVYKPETRGPLADKVGLQCIRFKPAKYFAFEYGDHGHYDLRQIDPNPNGTALPLSKFVHIINGLDDENPYGDSLSAKCAFWVWLKKNQAKFWAIFNERFGLPLTKVGIPRNAKPDDQTKAESIITEIQTRAGIVVPEGFDIEFMEAIRRGDITYDNFIERCNKEISKLILGATLISEEGKRGQGSYAMSSTHSDVLESYTIFDSIMTQAAINEQLIKRLVDFNYITDHYPRFRWSGMSISALISFAQSLGILAASGMSIPISYIHELTGIPQARDGEPILAAAQGSAGGLSGPDNRATNKNFGEDVLDTFADLPTDVQDEVIEAELLKVRHLRELKRISANGMAKVRQGLKKKS